MKRILQFIDNLDVGGKERQCVELVKGLSARGDCVVQVVCMSEKVFFREVLDLPRVDVRFLIRRVRRDPAVFVRFAALCRQWRPEVITVWDPMTAVYALPAAKLLRIPYVSSMTQEAPVRVPPVRAAVARLIFTLADVIVANSIAGLRAFAAPPAKSVVIHNGYEARRAQPEPVEAVRRRLCITQPLVVGMVATFSHYKDYPTFIHAARIVLARRDDVVFVALGDGPTLDDCRAMLAPGEQERIRLLGRVTHVEDLVALFDVGVLATFTEGISNAILEYMALGKPVVATDGGGTAEVVADGETGYLVPARDPLALADRLCELLADAAGRVRMGQRGRERIQREFTQQNTVRAFSEVYDRLSRRPRVRSAVG